MERFSAFYVFIYLGAALPALGVGFGADIVGFLATLVTSLKKYSLTTRSPAGIRTQTATDFLRSYSATKEDIPAVWRDPSMPQYLGFQLARRTPPHDCLLHLLSILNPRSVA